jgi:acetyl/propionyl-CoA carboxylase alpha subunit
MYRSRVNDKYDFNIEKDNGRITINGEPCELDIFKKDEATFHIIYKNKTYKATLTNITKDHQQLEIKINQRIYSIELSNEKDLLLKKLGLSMPSKLHADTLKAPMPGLIQDVLVHEGQEIKSGETLIILKAMKMENILKSPHDGIIKKINVVKNQKIEKDSVLIQF